MDYERNDHFERSTYFVNDYCYVFDIFQGKSLTVQCVSFNFYCFYIANF